MFEAVFDYEPTADGARVHDWVGGCPRPVRLKRPLTPDAYKAVLDISELCDALRLRFAFGDSKKVAALNGLFERNGLFADDGGGLRPIGDPPTEITQEPAYRSAEIQRPKEQEMAGNGKREDCEEYGVTSHPDPDFGRHFYPRY